MILVHRHTHLVCNVGSCFADVSAHFAHHTDVVVTVEEVVFVFAAAGGSARPVRCLVSLECRIAEDDDQSLRVLVTAGDRDMLLSDELGQIGRRERLRSWLSRRHVSLQRRCEREKWIAGSERKRSDVDSRQQTATASGGRMRWKR